MNPNPLPNPPTVEDAIRAALLDLVAASQRREDRGVSAEAMAQSIGIDASVWSRVLAGQKKLRVEYLPKLPWRARAAAFTVLSSWGGDAPDGLHVETLRLSEACLDVVREVTRGAVAGSQDPTRLRPLVAAVRARAESTTRALCSERDCEAARARIQQEGRR